ncbi:MFS transporter [Streptomyces sp. NPDC002838]|uniref:MFS transporter n=1 Tax=Streptomyces sp. NPDC002838 TaxID=3154436 RepID=UPI003323996E
MGTDTAESRGVHAPVRDRWWLIVAAGLAIFIAQLDASIVGVALPRIEADLHTSTTVVQWVGLGYLMPLIALALGIGRWVDTADPRRVMVLGCTGFAVASVACGLAPGVGWLIGARVVQGCFAVIMLALAPVLPTIAVRPEVRGRAFGTVLLLGTLGGVTGPPAGGLLVEAYGWPAVFYVNVPVVAVVLAVVTRQLPLGPRLPRPKAAWAAEAVTFGGAAVAVLFALSFAMDRSVEWGLLALAAVPLLLVWGRSASARSLWSLVTAPGLPGPHLAIGCAYFAVFGVLFVTPFFLQVSLGVPPGTNGWVMVGLALGTGCGSVLGGRLADRVGPRRVALSGTVVLLAGTASMVPASTTWGAPDVASRLLLIGVGFGLFNAQNQARVMSNAPQDRLGMISGTTSLVRQLGAAAGSALGAALWATSPGGATALSACAATAAVAAVCTALAVSRTSVKRPV